MSRTTLFARFRRAALLCHASRRQGRDHEEILADLRQRRVDRSRRRFITDTGAVAGAAALVGLGAVAPRAEAGDHEVVVVGAGIAGLTTALRLRDHGVRVRLFEAQNRIGGRILSLRGYFGDGQTIELGGEFINSDHVHMLGMAEHFGIELNDFYDDDPDLDEEVFFLEGQARTERELIEAYGPIAEAIEHDVYGIDVEDVTYDEPGNATDLDGLSMSDWFDRHGFDGWIRKLIEVAYTTEMGLDPEEQSALNFLYQIGTYPDSFDILGASDERFVVRGGNDRIVRALAGELNDVIETGSALESLRQDAGGRYSLSFRRDGGRFQVRADQVVLALPFTTLRDVELRLPLPRLKRRAIEELKYGTNAKLMVGFSERLWRERYDNLATVYSDLPFQTCWESSSLQPGDSGVLTNYTGGRHGVELGQGSARAQADKMVAELEQVFPGISETRDVGTTQARMHWPSNPWSKGSYLCYGPGQWTTLRGVAGESVDRLHFAGEHCALDNQGFMEGGCETGVWAADEALERLGVRPSRGPRKRR